MKGVIRYTAQPYGREVVFTTCEKALSRLSRRFNLSTHPEALGMTYDLPGGPLVVFVRDGSIPTLVHECCHAVLFILRWVGIDPGASNGEPMAYLLDHMVGRFLPHLSPASPPASPH